MNDGEIHARHYATHQPVCVRWKNGIITHIEPAPTLQNGDAWIAPGLVDLQVNGFAGIDFQQDNLRAEDLLIDRKSVV